MERERGPPTKLQAPPPSTRPRNLEPHGVKLSASVGCASEPNRTASAVNFRPWATRAGGASANQDQDKSDADFIGDSAELSVGSSLRRVGNIPRNVGFENSSASELAL